jgi:transposase
LTPAGTDVTSRSRRNFESNTGHGQPRTLVSLAWAASMLTGLTASPSAKPHATAAIVRAADFTALAPLWPKEPMQAALYRGGSRPRHAEELAMTADTILAIDPGKYKSVACAHARDTAAAEFRTVTTSRAELDRLIRTARPAVVVIEACTPAGWVHDRCGALGVRCTVASTAAEGWKYKHARRKTDRDDARRLAQLEALGQLPAVVVPEKRVREWRALIAHRQVLVTHRVAAQNRIRSILLSQGLPAPRGGRAWTAAGLGSIAPCAHPLAACGPDDLWRGLLDLARTA